MIDIPGYINATILPERTIFFDFENNEIWYTSIISYHYWKTINMMKEGTNIV